MQIQKAVESFQSETETKDDNKSDDENGETADLGPEDINQTASMIKGNCQNRVPAMSKTKICFIYIYLQMFPFRFTTPISHRPRFGYLVTLQKVTSDFWDKTI